MQISNKLIILFLLTILSQYTFGQTEVDSKISQVKVYQQNAQITRGFSFTAKPGRQEIVLTGISTYINPASLQIQLKSSNATLLSAKYAHNYFTPETKNKETEELQKRIKELNEQLIPLKDKRDVMNGVGQILDKHMQLDMGNSSFSAPEVIELSNAYETKYLQIKKSLRDITKEENLIREKIATINKEMTEINAKPNRPLGNIILQIDAKISSLLNIKCSYLVNNVGWSSAYDIRSEGITEDIQLNYKANIFQNTGNDWENVPLIVSTGNPSQNNDRPILNPLYADITPTYRPQPSNHQVPTASMNMAYNRSDQYTENTTVSSNQMNVDFKVRNRHSIKSDGKLNLIALESYKLDTKYTYHTVPKLDRGAFLIAKISDWGQYNLTPGEANIFFEDNFVGTSQINPQVTADSLLISLGRDKNIVVERVPNKEYTSSTFIGMNKKETIGYTVTVKNKKPVPIKIEILDQIPISKNNSIEIKLEKKDKATYSEDRGKLMWVLDIRPGQTRKKEFKYTVKSPKSKPIYGIK